MRKRQLWNVLGLVVVAIGAAMLGTPANLGASNAFLACDASQEQQIQNAIGNECGWGPGGTAVVTCHGNGVTFEIHSITCGTVE